MATRRQKITLAVFALVTGATLVAVLLVFAGMRFWEEHDEYAVEYDGTVLGLESGADVRLNGVRVGKVTSLAISPDDFQRVRISLEVDEGTPVRSDTRAILTYRGITGLKIIDLRSGTPGAPPLPTGSTIPVGETTIDKLERQTDQLVARMNQLMGGADVLISGLTRTSDEIESVVQENRAALHESVQSIGVAAHSIARFVNRDAQKFAASAGGLVAELKGVVRGSQGQIKAALLDIRRASGSVKELARDLRQKPSRLLFSQAPRDRKLP